MDKKIKKYNKELNCFLTLNDDLSSAGDGPLKDVPIAVKDNFCTKGLRTTASSKVLDDFVPTYESTVTRKLKEAGAIIVGKTNMDAWAHGSSTETSANGPTKNPWDTTRSPGGSSGGSTAAVSAGLVPVAIGSETAGSIRQPASWSGVVGLKPTYGRVSRYGLIAMCSSTDSPGPIGTNVEDVAKVLGVIAGKDQFDATSLDEPVPDYVKELKKGRKFTIGVPKEYFEGAEKDVKTKVEESIKILEKLGHKIKKISLIDPNYAISVYTIIQRSEVSSNLARFTGVRFGNDRTHFGDEAKRRIMLGTYALSHGYYDEYYKKAQKVRTLIIKDFKKVFKGVDLIVSPTTPTTAFKLGESEKYAFFGELMDKLAEPSSMAGLPGISVPCGLDLNNLPIGMQIVAPWLEEGKILDLAYQFEQETDYFGVIKKGLEKYE